MLCFIHFSDSSVVVSEVDFTYSELSVQLPLAAPSMDEQQPQQQQQQQQQQQDELAQETRRTRTPRLAQGAQGAQRASVSDDDGDLMQWQH